MGSRYDDIKSIINKKEYLEYTGYFVSILPKSSRPIYDKPFTPSDNKTKKKKPNNPRIREIDGQSFYALVFNDKNALRKFYDEFPKLIRDIIYEYDGKYKEKEINEEKRDKLFKKIFGKNS